MSRVRSVGDIDEFVGLPGDPADYRESIAGLWDSGESRPGWCFLLQDDSGRSGRIGFRVAPTTSDPAWLGTLPPFELSTFGLHLPWDGGYLATGRRLLSEALGAIDDQLPEIIEMRVVNEIHPYPEERRRLIEACGLGLFQEKQGFAWNDDGTEVAVPNRLVFRSVAEVGSDAYRAVMAPCGEGTLDRNDRYYWQGCGPDNWASQMMVYLDQADSSMWLLGFAGGSPVGYVAVVSDEEWGSTIGHIGVVPDQRGNGYIDDLIAAGTAAAQRAGITAMLSDVDVLNEPMMAAMRRAGHRANARPWHVWAYRGEVDRITAAT